jgi:hypothetical protein
MSQMRAPHQRAHWHDAYDSQMELWRWYRRYGEDYMLAHYRDNSRSLHPDSQAMLRSLYLGEVGRLLDCDPLYVSPEMCDLVDIAREDFLPEPLLETDLMTPRGFLYWSKPLTIPDRFERPQKLHGMSWTRIFSFDSPEIAAKWKVPHPHGHAVFEGDSAKGAEEELIEDGGKVDGIAVTLYAGRDDYLEYDDETAAAEHLTPIDEQRRRSLPRLLPMHLTPWYFGMTFEGNEWDEIGVPTAAEWWWRCAQTTFRLMQQKLSVKTFARPDRAARREAKRQGYPDTEVVIVRLRKEEPDRKEPSGEAANYSHRFLRAGHWRNQWYPSIQAHRQIRIEPTIVGDPSLPLIIRPRRVFQWER